MGFKPMTSAYTSVCTKCHDVFSPAKITWKFLKVILTTCYVNEYRK